MNRQKSLTESDKGFLAGLEILRRYCCFQERTIKDVKIKAAKAGMNVSQIEKALDILIDEDYLNEQRYAQSFVSGKMMHNKWGRIKIRSEMKQKQIDGDIIESALQAINLQDYEQLLISVIEKKALILQQKNEADIRAKLIRYALSKGFEYEMISSVVIEILKR